MNPLLQIFKDYGTQLSALAGLIGFIVGMWKYLSERRETHFWKEFEVYHTLVKRLVQPEDTGARLMLDRQAAVVFELRNFRRYYPYSLRMLQGIKKELGPEVSKTGHGDRLIAEIDLAIEFIEERVP